MCFYMFLQYFTSTLKSKALHKSWSNDTFARRCQNSEFSTFSPWLTMTSNENRQTSGRKMKRNSPRKWKCEKESATMSSQTSTRRRQISGEFLWVENSIESWNCLHVSKSSIEPGTNCETIEESEKRKEGSWRSKIREKSFTFPVFSLYVHILSCTFFIESQNRDAMSCSSEKKLEKKVFWCSRHQSSFWKRRFVAP